MFFFFWSFQESKQEEEDKYRKFICFTCLKEFDDIVIYTCNKRSHGLRYLEISFNL